MSKGGHYTAVWVNKLTILPALWMNEWTNGSSKTTLWSIFT